MFACHSNTIRGLTFHVRLKDTADKFCLKVSCPLVSLDVGFKKFLTHHPIELVFKCWSSVGLDSFPCLAASFVYLELRSYNMSYMLFFMLLLYSSHAIMFFTIQSIPKHRYINIGHSSNLLYSHFIMQWAFNTLTRAVVTRFLPMITVFTEAYEVVLPLKMGNHLYLPIRQMKSRCGKRGGNIKTLITCKIWNYIKPLPKEKPFQQL